MIVNCKKKFAIFFFVFLHFGGLPILNSCPKLAWTPGFGEIISSFGAKIQLAYYFENQLVTLRIFYDLKLKTIILRRHFKYFGSPIVTTRVMLLMSLSSEDMSFPSCPLFPSVNFVRRKPSTVNQWNEKTWTASPEIPWETLDKNRRAIFSWQHCDGTALLPNKDAEKESNNLQ